jgi:predicted DsbA family dithiol-disulfide isomerase
VDLPFSFALHRVPFFLEPGYLDKPDSFREDHLDRMVRKFGSEEAFRRFSASHGLVPRSSEAGLEGWTEEVLGRRVQSATLRSHRLVQWASHRHSLEAAEKLYGALNRLHFTGGGALNDLELLGAAAEVKTGCS